MDVKLRLILLDSQMYHCLDSSQENIYEKGGLYEKD